MLNRSCVVGRACGLQKGKARQRAQSAARLCQVLAQRRHCDREELAASDTHQHLPQPSPNRAGIRTCGGSEPTRFVTVERIASTTSAEAAVPKVSMTAGCTSATYCSRKRRRCAESAASSLSSSGSSPLALLRAVALQQTLQRCCTASRACACRRQGADGGLHAAPRAAALLSSSMAALAHASHKLHGRDAMTTARGDEVAQQEEAKTRRAVGAARAVHLHAPPHRTGPAALLRRCCRTPTRHSSSILVPALRARRRRATTCLLAGGCRPRATSMRAG